jgi:flagellar biogenesis protein FliO
MTPIVSLFLALLALALLVGVLVFALGRLQKKAAKAVEALRELDEYLASNSNVSTGQGRQKADP